ncbi:MAG TPA: alpha/beta hydrolase [Candidatus Saccharimonadia bacterium]
MGALGKIYILHGWTYSTKRWEPLVAWLKQQGFEPEMLHVPGLTAESRDVWDVPKYVEWLNQATAKHPKPFVLMGHSNGGRIGLAFAARYPKRIHHLILVDSAGIYHNEPLLQLKRLVFGKVAKAGKALTSSAKIRAALYKIARAQDYHQAPPNMRTTMINMHEADKLLPVEQIFAPTTIIWGREDRVTPLADGQALEQRLPHAKLHIIEGGRHTPVYTHHEEVGQIIVGALK